MNFASFANSRQTESNLQLDNIRVLLEILGNPEKNLKFIHVTGTNGKGSVCSFLQNIFTFAGYKTGKYISPELIRVNERISVDGEDISDDDINRLLDITEPAAKKAELLGYSPSQFEIWTAMAFLYFKEQAADIVIIETGLGGAGDATNIIPPPVIAVITKIDIDHRNYLGNTISEITYNKCGIIKTGTITVTAEQDKAASDIIEKVCSEKSCVLQRVCAAHIHSFNGEYEVFDCYGIKNIEIKNMLGLHQIYNASLAVKAALSMDISPEIIKKGIAAAKNPARFERFAENIVYDGAHNPNGMSALRDSLARYFPDRKKSFIFAVMSDKDIGAMIEIMKDFKGSRFYTVTAEDNPRSMSAGDLSELLNSNGFAAYPCKNDQAVLKALAEINENNELAVIMGSLYLYKKIRRIIGNGFIL